MKKVLRYISVVVLSSLALSSCSKLNELPTFDDNNAFVAFASSSATVSEDGGSVKIPLSLASQAGVAASVSVEAVDGSAKSGVNYTLSNSSVSFDSENREGFIEVSVVNQEGVFTGDLSFELKISDAGSVNVGAASLCKVTISDVDHPLASILGDWNASCPADYWGGPVDYTITLLKDDSDVSIVWFSNLATEVDAGIPADKNFYGVVNADMTEIVIPIDQTLPDQYSGYRLIATDSTTAETDNILDSGSAVIKIEDGKLVFDEYAFGLCSVDFAGFYAILLPPYEAIR